LYGEDTLGTLGAIEAEVRRTLRWLDEERRLTGKTDQAPARTVAMHGRRLQEKPAKAARHTPAMSEQKEALRKASQPARRRETSMLVRKWQPASRMPSSNITRASSASRTWRRRHPERRQLMTRIIDALEALLAGRASVGPRPRRDDFDGPGLGPGTAHFDRDDDFR